MRSTPLEKPADMSGTLRHVAIVMDGNRRWARLRGLPRSAGHRKGAEAVREVVRAAGEMGIEYLTLFGFSSQNWNRSKSEVLDLMGLLRLYLRNEVSELDRQNVRLKIIGDRARLGSDIVSLIEDAERRTEDNTGLTLTVAISYGGRDEIVQAAQQLAAEAASGQIDPAEINEDALSRRLWTAGLPDPDLLIRTSGEQRISKFLLWQLSYAELLFVDRLWPDFSRGDLESAVANFQKRERRFGIAGV